MVLEVVAGIGMDQHDEPVPLQREPGHQVREDIRLEGDLEAPHRMRPDRALMEATDRHPLAERLADALLQVPGARLGRLVEIDMRMPAFDGGAFLRGCGHALPR